jgi:hypothetical protein
MGEIYIPDRALIYFASVPRVDMKGGIWLARKERSAIRIQRDWGHMAHKR